MCMTSTGYDRVSSSMVIRTPLSVSTGLSEGTIGSVGRRAIMRSTVKASVTMTV